VLRPPDAPEVPRGPVRSEHSASAGEDIASADGRRESLACE
jgi:hypothetical protein